MQYSLWRFILLAIIAVVSWGYTISSAIVHREELIIQLAEIAEDVALPYRIAQLRTLPPDEELRIPVAGIARRDIADTWGEPRGGGRIHEGVDIFAPEGTPVYAAASGFVIRVGNGDLGGNYVFTIGAGGRRYYYAHLAAVAEGIDRGDELTPDTVIGFVGSTGNASGTPPHVHMGMYGPQGALNPYDLLVEREVVSE